MRGFAYWVVKALPVADALMLAFLVAFLARPYFLMGDFRVSILLLIVVPVTQRFLTRSGLYDSHRVEAPSELVRRVLIAHLLSAAILLPLAAIFAASILRTLASVYAVSFIVLAVVRAIVHSTLQILRRRGFDRRNVLLIATWAQAEQFGAQVQAHPEWGLRLDCVATGTNGHRVYRAFPDGESIGTGVEDILKNRVVDEVLISVSHEPVPEVLKEARVFEQYGRMVRAVFEPVAGTSMRAKIESFAGGPSLEVATSAQTEKDAALKRAFDLAIGTLLLLVLSPLMLLICALVKLTSPGPVLFCQTRVGLNGRRFRMFKFRTRVHGAEFLVRQADRSITRGPIFKDPRDYRITPVGRLLRKFSLDELPQLFNVLRGEMSVVGPRPLPEYEAEQIVGQYRRRFSVPPGLTCIWQVSGRSDVTYDRWMEYDLEYVDRWSMWSDAMLLLKTIPVVLTGRGGY